MAMMMTGRVLLVCALCVLWCGAAVEAEGDDVTEPQDEPSRASQSASEGGHEEEPDIRNPVGEVLNTSEGPLVARDLTKVSPQKTSFKQPPRDNGGAAGKEEKVEVKKVGDEETRSDGEEPPKDHSEGTQERDGPKENERNPSPTPAEKMLTSGDKTAEHAGRAGQAIRAPQSPESDGTRPSGSSVGGSKRGESSNLDNSASDGGKQSAVDGLGSGGGTVLDPNGGGGSSGRGGGSSRGDSSVSPLSTAGISSSSALDAPFVQSTQPSEKGLQSETMSLGTALPNEQPKERSGSKAKQGSSTSEEAAESLDDSGDAVEKEKEKGDIGPKATTSLSSTTSYPPVTRTTPRSSEKPSPTKTEVQAGKETSTENVTITKRNDTATPGDSDGSTAVSHTTSPLLLLLFACAAAAVVVAA
ncbi:Mucin-associated surface protein (MASP) [Trypanosoma cruzi]|uniref:Mucin-associated surface protein (MASP), putative n=2 Tax=Trypanosoma cruzi TaxID=5693 RepID=Q4DU47_TRYCC|nr:mucin-associated surface protein (MASP), putative [Trypanosoma cruzi]EAN96052.1 mucin-associated surface protein (MASP), putative [Trypanosoma cruzi]PWV06200.1 Mucin-associated surface protein (MASP) [Trypanosoma cruzi]|eukprot:XP_817903.1 mucin-associated surface protein (MASP) [Trypanosoma cruzi strain CL Brener]